jgi:hypothetical protein
MDWPIERMGPAAITFPNQREYARTAIQSFSLSAKERCIYTHSGWRKVGDRWIFLHGGGAIGGDGPVSDIDVRLIGPMRHFNLCLPSGIEQLASAVKASLRLLRLGPPAISYPLLAATCRAVFGEADFAMHLVGETGAFKSELAALYQQHFGPTMSRLNLPSSWSSTGNSLEVLAFQAKDALLVIDDFAPQGSASDVARYHAAADRVFRAAGNHAGRGRLDSTAKLRESKPPRALILSTGEDIPRGQSVRARIIILELLKGAIRANVLTECQTDARAGLYTMAMGAFLQWFAGRYEEVRAAFERLVSKYRSLALLDAAHARTPEIVANLQAAFELYLDSAVYAGALVASERVRLASACWEALSETAAAQAKHQAATEPTARFLALLRECLTSGRAHLQTTKAGVPDRSPESCGWRFDNQSWKSQGACIGWVDGENIYLEPTVAYGVIQMMARDMNEPFETSPQILKKRLSEKGLLASVEPKHETLTVRRSIAGSTKSVLCFLRSTLLPEAPDDEDDDDR